MMSNNKTQTIIGAGGVIGKGLATELKKYNTSIRLVGRAPQKINPDDEIVKADATDEAQLMKAVEGSDVVYLTLGLNYNIKTWQQQWPIIMKNIIVACKYHDSRLVFFDNVYMYGLVKGMMTEETPLNPCSRKGKVRMQIAGMLLDEINSGKIKALIARSADFYGPGATNTFVHPMLFSKLKKGKKASWLANDKVKHSFTFTPDAVKATALLGNTADAYGQIWHLPTHANALTGKEFIERVAAVYGVKPRYNVLSTWMMRMVGLFMSDAAESVEMMYQYEHEYLFSSRKFEQNFFEPTTYEKGIQITAESI